MNTENLREILTELIEPFAYPKDENWNSRINPTLAINNALAAIQELTPKWIKCSERLPEECDWVLGWQERSAEPPLVMRRFNPHDGQGWFWQIWSMSGICSSGGVTHWMPLPAAPEGEE